MPSTPRTFAGRLSTELLKPSHQAHVSEALEASQGGLLAPVARALLLDPGALALCREPWLQRPHGWREPEPEPGESSHPGAWLELPRAPVPEPWRGGAQADGRVWAAAEPRPGSSPGVGTTRRGGGPGALRTGPGPLGARAALELQGWPESCGSWRCANAGSAGGTPGSAEAAAASAAAAAAGRPSAEMRAALAALSTPPPAQPSLSVEATAALLAGLRCVRCDAEEAPAAAVAQPRRPPTAVEPCGSSETARALAAAPSTTSSARRETPHAASLPEPLRAAIAAAACSPYGGCGCGQTTAPSDGRPSAAGRLSPRAASPCAAGEPGCSARGSPSGSPRSVLRPPLSPPLSPASSGAADAQICEMVAARPLGPHERCGTATAAAALPRPQRQAPGAAANTTRDRRFSSAPWLLPRKVDVRVESPGLLPGGALLLPACQPALPLLLPPLCALLQLQLSRLLDRSSSDGSHGYGVSSAGAGEAWHSSGGAEVVPDLGEDGQADCPGAEPCLSPTHLCLSLLADILSLTPATQHAKGGGPGPASAPRGVRLSLDGGGGLAWTVSEARDIAALARLGPQPSAAWAPLSRLAAGAAGGWWLRSLHVRLCPERPGAPAAGRGSGGEAGYLPQLAIALAGGSCDRCDVAAVLVWMLAFHGAAHRSCCMPGLPRCCDGANGGHVPQGWAHSWLV
jgi:hypothetical protein